MWDTMCWSERQHTKNKKIKSTIYDYLKQHERCTNIELSWWRHQMETFPCCWPFVRGIHLSPLDSSHKDQWRGCFLWSAPEQTVEQTIEALVIWGAIGAHYDVTVMIRPCSDVDTIANSECLIACVGTHLCWCITATLYTWSQQLAIRLV